MLPPSFLDGRIDHRVWDDLISKSMNSCSETVFEVNGREYRPPNKPVAVICMDGSADEYLDEALARDLMPNVKRISVEGYRGIARGALPSFTNVNNSCIITGVPPEVHGIQGNFFLDPDTGEEVMMNSAKYLRAGTIMAAAERAGRKTGVVTAKEKLRDILSAGRQQGIAFSTEKARDAKLETHGIDNAETLVGKPTPEIYSADASLYVLEAGVKMVEKGLADFLYLSTTDFIQHKHRPTEQEALDFYTGIDREIGNLIAAGAIVAATADHGMNSKQKPDGSPNVIFLESALTEKFGEGFRIILPITDPYVLHHGALGSYAVVHTPAGADIGAIQAWIDGLPGITEVYDRDTAARKLQLPADRLGELVVMSGRDVVIGRTEKDHDLSHVASGLRSHGGRYEEMVPFLISQPLNPTYRHLADGDVRNYDIFSFATNGVQPA